MNSWTIVLPFPTSTNNLHRNVKVNVRPKSKAYKNWIKEADGFALQQKPFFIFEKRVDITVYLCGGTDASDCDNYLKAPIDYVVSLGVIKDDKKEHVRSAKAEWNDDCPGALIFIEECE